jgi:leucyl aminopeptidase
VSSVEVVAQFLSPADLAGLPDRQRGLLVAQGFHGAVGDRAVLTGETLTVIAGLGPEPGREQVRLAVRGLGLPQGTELRRDCLAEERRDVALARAVIAELVDAGYVPKWPGVDMEQLAWGEAESLALERVRLWTNAPGLDLTPARFADVALALGGDTGLHVSVLDERDLRDGRFGAILAVGQGSQHPPRLVDVRYGHPAARAHITLVGKGITFDTGGLSLKSPAAMAPMRMDKVGAATVLAVASVLPRLGLPVAVRAICPLAENMIGPGAIRPGDVVVGRSGVPITIVDTDFEGRVLLSDALAWAGEEQTDAIVDVAALTYQVAIALGQEIGGFFANDDRLAERLIEAGAAGGEEWWRLPLAQRYLAQVTLGDGVKNHPESDVGRAITAALFLEQFVPDGKPWAHLDITGPAWTGPASGPGASGFSTRTLLGLLADLAQSGGSI